MNHELVDFEAWRQVLLNSMMELTAPIAGLLPALAGTLLLLLVGWLVAKVAEAAAVRVLNRLGLDRASDRIGARQTLERAGLPGPLSPMIARLLFWIVMLTFVLSAAETLGLDAVTRTLDRLIAFLPSVIAAVLILVLGLLFARFVGSLTSSGAAAANLPEPRRLGGLASIAAGAIVIVVALEQLGIETAVLVQSLTALIAVVGITVGATFALGARSIVGHILAGHYLRQTLPQSGFVEVEGQRGVVERIGAVDTLFRDEERTWSVPNAHLLESTIRR